MAKSTKITTAVAPGQYLGFGLQPVRFCFHLLTADDDAYVSLEHIDDVAIHHSSGYQVLEQSKSALKQNPVSDWAEDLWKAFANWVDLVNQKTVDPKHASFRIYVTPVKTGKLVQLLSDAKSDEHVGDALAVLKKAVAALKTPPACNGFLQKFLGANVDVQREIVRNFTLESKHDDPVEAVRKAIGIFPQNLIDPCCKFGIGAAKEKVEALIREGKEPKLLAGEFKNELRAFVRKFDLSGLLISLATAPPPDVVQQTLSQQPIFVKQLQLIDAQTSIIMRAISDFLQTTADKILWAERGHVVKDSFQEFDEDLLRRHENISGGIADTYADKDAKLRGRLLYRQCISSEANLEGRQVPSHFVPGSFNALANVRALGWHPDFATLLDSQ